MSAEQQLKQPGPQHEDVWEPLGESESALCAAVAGAGQMGWFIKQFINHPVSLALHFAGMLHPPCSLPPREEGFLYGKSLSLQLCFVLHSQVEVSVWAWRGR